MPVVAPTAQKHPFTWPEGKRCGISLSFDDGRASAVDVGVPLFDRFGVKATFYVMPHSVEQRHAAWQAAADAGHEMGCHTLTHPCSGNIAFVRRRGNALEEYTLEQMEQELLGANDAIEQLLGTRPRTFAYPCYHTFVGKGEQRQSYVPLVARHFVAGRIGLNEFAADPSACDLAALPSLSSDHASWEFLKSAIDRAREDRSWLVFAGHDVSEPAPHGVGQRELEQLCAYCTDPANEVWIDTVANIGTYVHQQQAALV
ncbi:MAG: polysaccharide deacetylase family protein [Phycisphaeraceae bacterium]